MVDKETRNILGGYNDGSSDSGDDGGGGSVDVGGGPDPGDVNVDVGSGTSDSGSENNGSTDQSGRVSNPNYTGDTDPGGGAAGRDDGDSAVDVGGGPDPGDVRVEPSRDNNSDQPAPTPDGVSTAPSESQPRDGSTDQSGRISNPNYTGDTDPGGGEAPAPGDVTGQPPGAGPETIADPEPAPSPEDVLTGPEPSPPYQTERISTPNYRPENPDPTQGVETVEGAGGDVELAFAGRRREQQVLARNPGLDADDVRVNPDGSVVLTSSGREAVRGRARRINERVSTPAGGFEGVRGGTPDAPQPAQVGAPAAIEPSGVRSGGLSTGIGDANPYTGVDDRQQAMSELDRQIDDQFGTDLQAGEDYRVQRTRGLEGGVQYRASLTDTGQIAVGGRPRTGETWLDRNVINPAIRQAEEATGLESPVEGDVVQGTQEYLGRQAAIHRVGRGDLPNRAQAEAFGAKYAAPGVGAAAAVAENLPFIGPYARAAPEGTAEDITRGFYARGGQTVNPAGLALQAGKAVESVGEYTYSSAVASAAPAAKQAPKATIAGTDQTLQEATATAAQQQRAKEAAAGEAATKLATSTVESAQQYPARTAGAGLFEAGTVLAGEAASPIRVAKLDVPTGRTGTTTVRAVRLETPRAVRAATGRRSRGRTLVGQKGGRLSRGAPTVDVDNVRFTDLQGQGATTELVTPFETDVYQKSVGRYGGQPARRVAAQERVADLAQRADDELKLTSTEDIVREVESVPRERVGAVARTIEDLDAEIYGSASVRAQFPERARKPGDLDLAVGNEVRARTKLSGALEGSNADVDDVFDFSAKSEKARPGQPVKLGRIAQERLETDEGVPVTRASEEFVKKTGAAGFLRGAGSPGPEYVGASAAFDVGPEPIRPDLPPRYKDVGDVSVVGRLLLAEQAQDAGVIGRRRVRQGRQAVEEYEMAFAADMAEVPESRRPATTPDLPETERLIGGVTGRDFGRLTPNAQRGQLTLVDMLGGGRRADGGVDIDAEGALARRLGVTDETVAAARRADSDLDSGSAARRAVDDADTVPAVGSSPSGGRVDDNLGVGSSPSAGRSDGGVGLGSSPGGRRDEDSGGFTSFFQSRGGGGRSPTYGGGGDDGGGGGGGGYGFDDNPTIPIYGYNSPGDQPGWSITTPGGGGSPDRDPDPLEEPGGQQQPLPDEIWGEDTPAIYDWYTETAVDLALGAAPRRAPSQEALAQYGDNPIQAYPTLVQLEGSQREQQAIEAVQDFLLFGDGQDEGAGGLDPGVGGGEDTFDWFGGGGDSDSNGGWFF